MIEIQTNSGTSVGPPKLTSLNKSHHGQTSTNHLQNIMTTSSTSTTANSAASQLSNGMSYIGHRPRSGSAREQALHAVEYYNSNVLRARLGAGLSGPRSSVNERHLINTRTNGSVYPTQNGSNMRVFLNQDQLCRSNSSLELLHDQNGSTIDHPTSPGGNLRREYGSHGSIDVISSPSATTSESFFAMLQDYRPAVLGVSGADQRSPGPAEFLKGKVMHAPITNGETLMNQSNNDNSANNERSSSPKLRNKLNRLWGPHITTSSMNGPSANGTHNKNPMKSNLASIDDCSILSSTLSVSSNSSMVMSLSHSMASHSVSTSSADIEERQRRRAFAHFDCQSLTANLGYAAKLRGLLLARRRNTTTGASAASMMNARSATPDVESGDEDFGDGQYNDLIENCPFFRNEVGSEEEREVSLTRMNLAKTKSHQRRAIHRPGLAYGVSILECPPSETLWRHTTCPFQRGQRPIETVDHGARYYRQYFEGEEHQNWFGMDEQLGPVAISIKREKLAENQETHQTTPRNQFRMIIRTSELLTLRGSVIEDSIPNIRGVGKSVTTKEVLEYVAPEIQLNCLRLGVNTPQCEQQLMKLDEQGLTNKYKVGILYCRAGQSSEEDMYNNEDAGPAFAEFLETIGKRVRLKGFEHYKAGLDNKTDSTGTHSLYATHQECEIMFHVSTMLPFTPNNRQQLLRKRHIGNDIVTIVFQEPGALPFTPKNIRSQFQHVFLIVRVVNPCSENTSYRVAVSRSKDVPVFGPPILAGALFPRNKSFADFLVAKVINAENAAHRSEKFATMATRTRQEYLKDLATNYCTTTVVDPGTKFSIFPSKKKEKPKVRFSGDALQRGAFCWQVVLQDSGLSSAVDCFLGISVETFVLIEECSRQIVFVTPTKSILGWSTNGNSLRVYHHQGECLTINMRDCGERDEQLEVIERLRAVTTGCGALELNLRRNPMGQLGFHVQPDGVVTQVENSGQAWAAGLRQGYRLVEICKIAVATLSHDQMVDLLKTSAQVTVTVIESFSDHTPRRGCFLQNCKFNVLNFENEHESSTQTVYDSPSKSCIKKSSSAQLQQPSASHQRRYERNFSPPRSSNSSGYGTGSSSRSFSIPNEHNRQIPDMGTLTSSSSGHSSNDDRWYDILEHVEQPHQSSTTITASVHNHQNHQPTVVEHPKLVASSSLPLNSNPRPLSIHDPSKMTSLMNENYNRPAPRMANVEYLITKPPNQNHRSSEPELLHLKNMTTNNDGNITDSSSINNEPIYSTKSITTTDDEIGNIDISPPRLRRSTTTSNVQKLKNGSGAMSSSSTSSSRNNSPRPVSEAMSASVAAKLRPGVTNRNQAHLLQRNSVNYSNSTFQEDLMRLINPDYMSSDDSLITSNGLKTVTQKNIANSHSLGNISVALSSNLKSNPIVNDDFLSKKKSRSREAINLGQHPLPELRNLKIENSENEPTEVIYTTARPATVISQSNNNNNNNNNNSEQLKTVEENVLHISEGTPFKKPFNISRKKYEQLAGNSILPVLPGDTSDMDWSTLVDTATRAIMIQFQEEQRKTTNKTSVTTTDDEDNKSQESIYQTITPNGVQLQKNGQQNSSGNAPELQSHLNQLEDQILRETRRRKSLEHAVRRLTEENRRLQDESQAAVQQLRRFTEWFFQTIDRQS